ncbi:unnamed protein product [Phytomonas sp. Hart1]|nr:unnamed protein product [Phytomonas sp. Hart1]|eukprot:CCW66556.1 unnamed protein product [Phytomonas sp. isolate Hart1]
MFKYSLTLDGDLVSTLYNFQRSTSSSSVVITIENEDLKNLCDPIPSTGILSYNLRLLRLALQWHNVKAAYVVMRLPVGTLCLIIFIDENLCSRESMKYLFGHSNLCSSLGSQKFCTIRVHNINEIQSNLFENISKEKNCDDLMTESERLHKEISMMEVVPNVTPLPFTLIPLSEEARDIIQKYAVGLVDTVTFMILNNQITVDCVLDDPVGDLLALKRILPDSHHRYVFTHYNPDDSKERKDIMIYLCPLSHDVKERFMYASAKTSFISFAKEHGITFHIQKEGANFEELVSMVKEFFSDNADALKQVSAA